MNNTDGRQKSRCCCCSDKDDDAAAVATAAATSNAATTAAATLWQQHVQLFASWPEISVATRNPAGNATHVSLALHL